MPSSGERSAGPHELIAIRAPGFRRPRIRAAAISACGSKMMPHRERAASNVSGGKSREEASFSTNSTLSIPAASARSRP
jgi:hypothetical protein